VTLNQAGWVSLQLLQAHVESELDALVLVLTLSLMDCLLLQLFLLRIYAMDLMGFL
jgi:hypothetical protein